MDRKEYLRKYYLENKERIKKYREENNEHLKTLKSKLYYKNIDKIKQQKQKLYNENKISILNKKKEYYNTKKNEIQQYQKYYRKNNKDKIKEANKIWSINNIEKKKEYNKIWSINNKEKTRIYMKNYTKCKNCGLFQTRKENNWLCSYCNPNITVREKTKELKIKTFLEEHNYEFEYNIYCTYQEKGYFPDFKIKSTNGNFWIIIECDEKAHKTYNKIDEKEREKNICLALNQNCVFLRFNPDAGFKKGIKIKTKLLILKSYIEYYINKEQCQHNLEVCYLFY